MAIARKPSGSRIDPEKAAEAFIHGGARLPTAGADEKPAGAGDGRKTPIMLRFDADLLRRVDAAARRRGISRSAWIAFKISEALDQEGA